MRDEIATARADEVRALTSALDPARYVVGVRGDRVAVRTVGRGTRYFYTLSALREFCESHRVPATPGSAANGEETELLRLRQRVLDLEAEIRRIGAERDALQARLHPGPGRHGTAGDDRFGQAKRVFAKLFHPDYGVTSRAEPLTRADVFRRFWVELERIEKG